MLSYFHTTAYERLTRTIAWGNEIIEQLKSEAASTESLAAHAADWTESAAFFVNFITDGEADSKLMTLGYDPKSQEPTTSQPIDSSRLQEIMSMRVRMLQKWFPELLAQITEGDLRRWALLNLLDQNSSGISDIALQERVELDTPTLHKELYHLSRQFYVEWDKDNCIVAITQRGREVLRFPTAEIPMTKHSGTRDLIFFNYAGEDRDNIEKIHGLISGFGFNTWWDKANLIPGQDWRLEIEKAIEAAAVCLIFFSSSSIDKTGFVNKEIKKILDRMDEMPEHKVFMIPVRLDECEIPRRLRNLQVRSCSDPDWHKRLIAAIRNAI